MKEEADRRRVIEAKILKMVKESERKSKSVVKRNVKQKTKIFALKTTLKHLKRSLSRSKPNRSKKDLVAEKQSMLTTSTSFSGA